MSSNPLTPVGQAARAASRVLASLPTDAKNAALGAMAEAVRSHAGAILAANKADMSDAAAQGRNAAFLDRLLLTEERVAHMAAGIEKVAALPDPVGAVIDAWERPNGLCIRQVRVPIGVVGFIYESRGTVTCDAAALCFKSGNAVILRGGREARRTNRLLAGLLRTALRDCSLPEDAVQLLAGGEHAEVADLCSLEGYVDVVIPRGGKNLIRAVMAAAKVPVLKHLDGICHLYVDEDADVHMAVNLADDAKTQRPGVCNAVETILVHADVAPAFLPLLAARLRQRGVECRVCPRSLPYFGATATPATEEDWRTEYEDLIVSVKVVDSLQEAVAHINEYGSHHSDAIVTENAAARDLFLRDVDSACVYWNASTRFSDGEEFGFGAEIGIGTDKLHARGPMALRELTSYKYEILGAGQVKDAGRLPGSC